MENFQNALDRAERGVITESDFKSVKSPTLLLDLVGWLEFVYEDKLWLRAIL